MANEEHVTILRQGVKEWNVWREENRVEQVDLTGSDFRGANLYRVDLQFAKLSGAVLKDAVLGAADFRKADLRSADLRRADLSYAILPGADLRGADLREANLEATVLTLALMRGVDFSGAQFGLTVLSGSDLQEAAGLETIWHTGPSIINLDESTRRLHPGFLKGCGFSDWEIEAAKLHNLSHSEDEVTAITYEVIRIRGFQPIQLNPLFISYSSFDDPFVEVLEPRFDKLGIRYWRDVHGLKAGRLETQIDRAIRLNPTVLLVLSARSVESDWVEWEVGQARKLEKELGRDVLCPVALDDAWKTCSWPGPLRRQIEDYVSFRQACMTAAEPGRYRQCPTERPRRTADEAEIPKRPSE